MAREKKTRYALLGLLSMGAASGYGLKQRIQQTTAHFWSESYGQIYPELARMEKDGLVRSHEEHVEGQGPGVRRVFSTTDEGLNVLQKWLNETPAPELVRSEFLLKVFFGVHADRNALLNHLDKKAEELTFYAAYLSETGRWILNCCQDNPHAPYWMLAVRTGVTCAEAQATALKEMRVALAAENIMQSHLEWLARRPVSDVDPTRPIHKLEQDDAEDENK